MNFCNAAFDQFIFNVRLRAPHFDSNVVLDNHLCVISYSYVYPAAKLQAICILCHSLDIFGLCCLEVNF
jgi:hypothetical protein